MDQLSEKYYLYCSENINRHDCEKIKGNALVLTNENKLYRIAKGKLLNKKTANSVIKIKNRVGLPMANALRRFTDDKYESGVNHILREVAEHRTQIPNQFAKGFRHNILRTIAESIERIAQSSQSTISNFDCLTSLDLGRQVTLVETFLRTLDPKLDKPGPVALMLSQREFKGLNTNPQGRDIFSPWALTLWIFNYFRNSNGLSQFIQSHEFIRVMKDLLNYQTSPFSKSVMIHNYLESERQLAPECQKFIDYAKILYWRAYPWSTPNSPRANNLAIICADFVKGTLPEEMEPSDLFKELADKLRYESDTQLDDIKLTDKSIHNPLVTFIQVNLTSKVLTPGSQTPDEIFIKNIQPEDAKDIDERLLTLIGSALEYIQPIDLCWNVADRLLGFLDPRIAEQKQSALMSPFDRFTGNIRTVLSSSDLLSPSNKILLRNKFLLLLNNRYTHMQIDPALMRSCNKLIKLSRGLPEISDRSDIVIQLQHILKLLRTNLEISKRKNNRQDLIMEFSCALEQVKLPYGRLPAFNQLCQRLEEEVDEVLYEAKHAQAKKLIDGLKIILKLASIQANQLSDPKIWSQNLGKLTDNLEELQSVFMRWRELYPMLGISQSESKTSLNSIDFSSPINSDNPQYTQKDMRVLNAFRGLLLSEKNPRHFFAVESIGEENGEGKIIKRLLNFYLSNGNDIVDEGEQSRALLTLVEKDVLSNQNLLKNVMEFIFKVINPVELELEARWQLEGVQSYFMEILFLHWNQMVRKALLEHWDDAGKLEDFSKKLLSIIKVVHTSFIENNGRNISASKLPGSLIELNVWFILQGKDIGPELWSTFNSLLSAQVRSRQGEAAALEYKFVALEEKLDQPVEILNAAAYVINQTVGALISDNLPGSFKDALEVLLLNKLWLKNVKEAEELKSNVFNHDDAKSASPVKLLSPLERLQRGKHFSDETDYLGSEQFGFSLKELVGAIVNEAPAQLQRFSQQSYDHVSEYNLRENIGNIVDALDSLGGCRLIRLEELPDAMILSALRKNGFIANTGYIRHQNDLYYFKYELGNDKIEKIDFAPEQSDDILDLTNTIQLFEISELKEPPAKPISINKFDEELNLQDLGYNKPLVLSPSYLTKINNLLEGREDEEELKASVEPEHINVPRKITVNALLQGMMRSHELTSILETKFTAETTPEQKAADFPIFKNCAQWYSKFHWIVSLLDPQKSIGLLFNMQPTFDWKALGIIWGGCDLVVMDEQPTLLNIKELSLISNAAYILHQDKWYYANNINEINNDIKQVDNNCTLRLLEIKNTHQIETLLRPDDLEINICRKLTTGELTEISGLIQHKHFEKVKKPWEDQSYQLFHAIEKRYMELLPQSRALFKREIMQAAAIEWQQADEKEQDLTLRDVISLWDNVKVTSYQEDTVTKYKLSADFNKFGGFLAKLLTDSEKSKLANAGYFPFINGLVGDQSPDTLTFTPNRLENKIKNLLTRPELQPFFLQKLASICSPVSFKKLSDYIQLDEQAIVLQDLLICAWNVLALEMMGPPKLSPLKNTRADLDKIEEYDLESDNQLMIAASEDSLLIHHLIAWLKKITNGSKENLLHLDSIQCLYDLYVIFKQRFSIESTQDLSVQLYKKLVDLAIWEWFSNQSKMSELIAIIRLSSIAGLPLNQLDYWTRSLQKMKFVPGSADKEDLFKSLGDHKPPFTRWTLIEDYLESRSATKDQPPFQLTVFIVQYLQDTDQTLEGFFSDLMFDADAYNATSFVVCVLRKLGMNPEKQLVNFADMIGSNSLQNQLIHLIKPLIPNYSYNLQEFVIDNNDTDLEMEEKLNLRRKTAETANRLNGFITMLLGVRIELLNHCEPSHAQMDEVINQKCIHLLKKPDGGYQLGVYIPKWLKSEADQKAPGSSEYHPWNLPSTLFKELKDNSITQAILDADHTLRQELLNYAADSCGSVTLGALEAWPSVPAGKEFTRRLSLNDIPRPSGNIAHMITGVIKESAHYELYLVSEFNDKDWPTKKPLNLPLNKNLIILTNDNTAFILRTVGGAASRISAPITPILRSGLAKVGEIKTSQKVKAIKVTGPAAAICNIIEQVTTKAGHTFSPNLEISNDQDQKFDYEMRRPSEERMAWHNTQLPCAIAHKLSKNFTKNLTGLDQHLKTLQELHELSWLKPLHAYLSLLGYKQFTEECVSILESGDEWITKVQRLVQQMENCLGIRLKQDPDCLNFILNFEYEKIREIFESGLGRLSEHVLKNALILSEPVELDSDFRSSRDQGIIATLSGNPGINEKNFRTHCLGMLHQLSQRYSQSMADREPLSDQHPRTLNFVDSLPGGSDLLQYEGQYLLVSKELPPKFKFSAQWSVDNEMLQTTNLLYFDKDGLSHPVYLPPDMDFININLETSLLSSVLSNLKVISSDSKDEADIERSAQVESKNNPVLVVTDAASYLYGNVRGEMKLRLIEKTGAVHQEMASGIYEVQKVSRNGADINYTIYDHHLNRKIKGSVVEKNLPFTLNEDPKALVMSLQAFILKFLPYIVNTEAKPPALPRQIYNGKNLPEDKRFDGVYQQINKTKVHLRGAEANVYSEITLSKSQLKKIYFSNHQQLLPIGEEKCELIWIEKVPAKEYKNCLILTGKGKDPVINFKDQANKLSPGVLRSGLYHVADNRIYGVRVHISGAAKFNKRLDKIIKSNGLHGQITLSANQAQKLINRHNLGDNLAGTMFPIVDSILKLLQGGERPDTVVEVRLSHDRFQPVLNTDIHPQAEVADENEMDGDEKEVKSVRPHSPYSPTFRFHLNEISSPSPLPKRVEVDQASFRFSGEQQTIEPLDVHSILDSFG